MTLRELRLWHWGKVLSFRASAERSEAATVAWEAKYPGKTARYDRQKAKAARGREAWHLKAVEALSTVVEGDMELSDAQKAPRHRC